jgi:leucyl/phenylalanyl-tRNA--protein transferase
MSSSTPPNPAGQALTPSEQAIVNQAIAMYRQGWFPMAELEPGERQGTVEWVQPHERSIIPLVSSGLNMSRSLEQRVRSRKFRVTTDLALREVLEACAAPRMNKSGEPELGWLSESIIELVVLLGRAGIAHSIEAWLDGAPGSCSGPVLVGGLYGITVGSIFCGESMFSRPDLGGTDASKVCLVHLWRHLRQRGFDVLDTQILNPHMQRLGAREIRAAEYHELLEKFADRVTNWGVLQTES